MVSLTYTITSYLNYGFIFFFCSFFLPISGRLTFFLYVKAAARRNLSLVGMTVVYVNQWDSSVFGMYHKKLEYTTKFLGLVNCCRCKYIKIYKMTYYPLSGSRYLLYKPYSKKNLDLYVMLEKLRVDIGVPVVILSLDSYVGMFFYWTKYTTRHGL